MKDTISGKDLLKAGYTEGKILGLVLELVRAHFKDMKTELVLDLFRKVKDQPERYLEDQVLQGLAKAILETIAASDDTIPLREEADDYAIYGAEQIEAGARLQMDIAMKLPVTVAGALMPDAHQGYGLPIGGVLATRNAVIPYGVGVDIGCRMAMTIFDIPEEHFLAHEGQYKRELIAHTQFGAGAGFHGQHKADHEVLDSAVFGDIRFVGVLRDKAWAQLGSSGGGNHFVEWGIIDFAERDEALNVDKGSYVALLSHSGSRGLGATIAGHYTRLAKQLCRLPKAAANLAYLDMDEDAGREYWLAMNLAGEYASACHEVIHRKLVAAVGGQVLAQVENHHNFAWKEKWKGEDVIVHRKGATPAGHGVMGIIPGSMTAPGFLVRGKGAADSINSASHGAGRQMSRTKAMQQISRSEMQAALKAHGVSLIGAGLDEAPMAYKNIHEVMAAQSSLVETVATFRPKLVRMANDGSRED